MGSYLFHSEIKYISVRGLALHYGLVFGGRDRNFYSYSVALHIKYMLSHSVNPLLKIIQLLFLLSQSGKW